jgi:hypothetical protein
MNAYTDVFWNSFSGYARYFFHEVMHPHWGNYFYWLLAISLLVYVLELLFPWRKNQPKIRQDFWLDAFYMFFNFFLFSLIGYAALSDVVVKAFNDFLASAFGIQNLLAIRVAGLPYWAQLLIYHFMETIVYRSLEYLPLAMIGFGIQDFILVHLFALTIGHLNHANIYLPLGPLQYVFNSPQMHIWHHSKTLPEGRYGVNYGITLSVWDYLFGTVWMPGNGRDIELGFNKIEQYPHGFWGQVFKPFRRG